MPVVDQREREREEEYTNNIGLDIYLSKLLLSCPYMKRCVIDPVLTLEDEKLGGKEYRKVFRDAKLAIARAFKVAVPLSSFCIPHLVLCSDYMFPIPTCGVLTHSALYIDIECCFFIS